MSYVAHDCFCSVFCMFKDLTQLKEISIGGSQQTVHVVMSSLPVENLLHVERLDLAAISLVTMKMCLMPLLKSSASSLKEMTINSIHASNEDGPPSPFLSPAPPTRTPPTYITMPNLRTLTTPNLRLVSPLEFPIINAPLEDLNTSLPAIILAHMLASCQSQLKQLVWDSPQRRGDGGEDGEGDVIPSLLSAVASASGRPYFSSLNDVPLSSCQYIEQLAVYRSYTDFISILSLCRSSTKLTELRWRDSNLHPRLSKNRTSSNTDISYHQLVSLLASLVNLTKFRGAAIISWCQDNIKDDHSNNGHHDGYYCLERLTQLTLEGNWLPFVSRLRLPSVTSLSISDSFFNEGSLTSLKSSSVQHIFSLLSSSSQLNDLRLTSYKPKNTLTVTIKPMTNKVAAESVIQTATPPVNFTSILPSSPPLCYSLKRLRRMVFDWKVDIDIIIGLFRTLCVSENDLSSSSSLLPPVSSTTSSSSMPSTEMKNKERSQLTRFHYYPLEWPRYLGADEPLSYNNANWLTIIPLLPTTITYIGPLSTLEQVKLALHHFPHLRTIQILKLRHSEATDIYHAVTSYCRDVRGCTVPFMSTPKATDEPQFKRCIPPLDDSDDDSDETVNTSLATPSSKGSSSSINSGVNLSLPHPPQRPPPMMIAIHVGRGNGAGLLEGELVGPASTWSPKLTFQY
jgi:hypothetical protein